MQLIQVNLLPQEMRRKSGGFGVSKAIVAGVVTGIALVVLLTGATYLQKIRLANVQEDIARVEAKTRRMKKDIELVDRLVDVKTRIVRRLSAIETLDRNRAAWVRNLEDLATVIPDFLWLSEFRQGGDITTTTTKRRSGALQAKVDSTGLAQKNKLTLQGYCYTVSSLANFVLNMQDSPRFSDIKLNYARITDINERKVYDFQVACRLEPVTGDEMDLQDAPETSDQLSDMPSEDEEFEDMLSAVALEDE